GVSTGTGTSFATAVVSGVAALLLSVARQEGYHIDPLDIRQILIESAAPCELEGDGACNRYLAGTLDAAAALAAVHRAGGKRGPVIAMGLAGVSPRLAADRDHQSIADFGMGGLPMSN